MAHKATKPREAFAKSLLAFAGDVRKKIGAMAHGDPEAQLVAPVEKLFASLSDAPPTLKAESRLEGRHGRPDFAVLDCDGVLVGYIELKAPGKGADPSRYRDHDRSQWEVFRNLPNVLYTDGDSWALYRNGERVGAMLRLDVDFSSISPVALAGGLSEKLHGLLEEFLGWEPVIPAGTKALAAFLAPYCQLLRDAVAESLRAASTPIGRLRAEMEALLFPDATEEQFADSYAQTVLFALLLARMEGADTQDLRGAVERLGECHLMLSRSLQFLTDASVGREIGTALAVVSRVTAAIPPPMLNPPPEAEAEDPWLFFYEHFLAAYDPELRKQAGAYYTPIEVVHCQVRLVDRILTEEFGRRMGYLEPALTLDPAVGTGTYLLAAMEHALERAEKEEGRGTVRAAARGLASTLRGFEWLAGPYAVAQLRLTQAFARHGVSLGSYGCGVYLTNALDSPTKLPPAPSLFHDPIAREYRMAKDVKDGDRVIVIMGNPPYGRHPARGEGNQAATGAWVRYGDGDDEAEPILEDFLRPARQAGHGVHLKNLYNLYVYFMRWALWKAFEHGHAENHAIVTFITASSYLDGDAFVGLRRHMRKVCERIDVMDLGGDGRGTRQEENVFDIQTPVAIFFAWRKRPKGLTSLDTPPARVRYLRVPGTRAEKLAFLESVTTQASLEWQDVEGDWNSPFTPGGGGEFFAWPRLQDLMPWQSSGVQCSRTWPIGATEEVLADRWDSLLEAGDRAGAFKEGRDLRVSSVRKSLFGERQYLPAIESLPKGVRMEPLVRYGHRSFDRKWLLADSRVITRPRPPLWDSHGDRQVYFASLFSQALGAGPALTCTSEIPDLDFFRGSYGAKVIFPLFHDAEGMDPNVAGTLLDFLSPRYGMVADSRRGLAVDLAAYAYALLAQPAYTEHFCEELSQKELRVPLTKDKGLFDRVAAFGRRLIDLHTYGERMAPAKKAAAKKGRARCVEAVPDTEEGYPEGYSWEDGRLHVGAGVFEPVGEEIYGFEVSGLRVVQSWLGYRMKLPKGRKSSPLDSITPRLWTHAFTAELLELLWLLEATMAGYGEQEGLLDEVLASPLFRAAELPPVPGRERGWRGDECGCDAIEIPDA